jgi:thiamine-phosphate pyrophosphorylase
MTPEIYIIAPPDAQPDALQRQLKTALERTKIAALLLPRGDRTEADYRALVRAITPSAQVVGAAVLIEGEPSAVRELNVDGLHVTDGLAAVRAAIAALKPDFIVGVGNVRSRHDAMQKGEAGVDYILFGPLSGPIHPAERGLARWWAGTMEIASVLSDPDADLDRFDAEGCEFIGLNVFAGAPVR